MRTVIVEDASRFARELVTQELGIIALIKRGVRVLTASGDDLTDSSDPSRKMMRQIAGSFAEYEKARLVAKLKAAREPGNPLVLRGARNVRTLSAAFIADLQEDWEKYGTQILQLMREKFPDLYFASIVKLAQIVRIEADVSLKEPKPKTIEEVLQRVEHETGVEGRRAFEGFLKKMHKTKEEQGG